MTARPLGSVWRLLAVAALAVTTSGCGVVSALADPPPSSAGSSPPTATSSPPATSSPSGDGGGDGGRVVARVDVSGPGGQPPATVTVTLRPEGTGATALNALGSSAVASCGLTDDSTRWLPFEIDFADHGAGASKQDNEHSNLAARVQLRGVTGRTGDVGVLLGSGVGDSAGCATAGQLPAGDSFSTVVISGGYHVPTAGFVVARVPAGGADPLSGLTLALTGLRKAPDDIYPPGSWAWQVRTFDSGAVCPDDPASVCVPLG